MLILFIVVTQLQKYRLHLAFPNNRIITYALQGKSYQLLVADTPSQWEKGLMFYRKLDGVDGMIFLFPDKTRTHFLE